MKLKRFLISIIFSLALLFTGCSEFFTSIYVFDGRTDDYVVFTGIMENYRTMYSQKNMYSSQRNARSIDPEISIYDYDFYLFGQADYTNSDNVIGPFPVLLQNTSATAEDGTFTCELPRGTWYLTLAAFKSVSNGGTKPTAEDFKYFHSSDSSHPLPLLTASVLCDVSESSSTKPRFTLSPEGLSSKGSVNLQIKLDGWNILNADNTAATGFENIGVKAGINQLNSYAQNPVVSAAEEVTFTNVSGTDCASYSVSNISNGSYEFNLIFYNKNDETQTWIWSDTLKIFPGKTTDVTVNIPEINLSAVNPPEAPSAFKVSHYKINQSGFASSDGLYYATIFEWTDNSYTEDGFEILLTDIDDSTQTLSFDKNISTYLSNYVEGSLYPNKNTVTIRIPFGHRYKAQLRAYNRNGESAWVDAELKTTNLDSKAEAFKQLGADSSAGEWNALNMYKVYYFLNGGQMNEAVTINGQSVALAQTDFIQYGPVLSGSFDILDKDKIIKRLNAPDHWARNNSKDAPDETATTYDGYQNLSLWAIYPEYMLDEPPAPPANLKATPYEISDTGFLSGDATAYGVTFEWTCDDNDADFEIRLKDVNTNETILMNKYITSDADRYISVASPYESSLAKGSKKLHAYVPFGNVYSVEIRSIKGNNKSHKDNETWVMAASNINMFKMQYNLSGGYANMSGTMVADPVVYGKYGSPSTLLEKTSITRSGINPDKFYTDSLFTAEYTETTYSGYQNIELWANYPNLKSPSDFKISHYKTDNANFLSARKNSYAVIFEWDYPASDTVSTFEIRLQDADNPTSYIVMNSLNSDYYKVTGSSESLDAGSRTFEGYVPFGKRYIAEIYAVNSGVYSDPEEDDTKPGKGKLIDTGLKDYAEAFVRQTSDTTDPLYEAMNMFTITYNFNGGYNYKDVTLREGLVIPAPVDTENNLEEPFMYICDKNSYESFAWFNISDTDKNSIYILEDNNPKFFTHWGTDPTNSAVFDNTTYNGYSNLVLWAQYKQKPSTDTTGEDRSINTNNRLKYKIGNGSSSNVPSNAFVEDSGSRITVSKGTSITFTLAPTTKKVVSLTNVDSFIFTDLSVKVLNNKDRIIKTDISVNDNYEPVKFINISQTGYNSTHTWTITTTDLAPGNYSMVIEGTSNSYDRNMDSLTNKAYQVATVFFTVTN